MKETNKHPSKSADLGEYTKDQRKKEKVLKTHESFAQEAAQIIQELNRYQDELEMQNEELRQGKVELEESRSRYADLYDFAPAGYIILDHKGRIQSANLTAAGLLGIDRSQLANEPFSRYVCTRDADTFHKHHRHVFETGGSQSCELQILGTDGTPFYAELHSDAVNDIQGQVSHCRTAITDITQHRQSEDKVHQQREFLTSVLESITHPLYVIDAHDYTIKMANTAAGDVRLVGKTKCHAHIHQRDVPCSMDVFDCPLEMVIETKKPATVEHTYDDEDGNSRCIEIHAYPILDQKEDVVQVIEYCLDISERKDAEARQLLTREILERLNQREEFPHVIRDILALIKEFGRFSAVGIRLHEGDDFPYFEVTGFSNTFVAAEDSLCARNEAGEPILNVQEHPVLECMCGSVLLGRTDPSSPCFTEAGSFWTNSTTKMLAAPLLDALQLPMRGRCSQAGYESVALIPLRCAQGIVGLLQLNCIRAGRFSTNRILFLEGIAASIGMGLARIEAVELLRQNEDRYRSYIEVTGQLGWTTNASGEVVGDIPTWRRFTGQSQPKVQNWGWLEAVHPDDRERTEQAWRKALADKTGYETEYRIRRNDGLYRYFLARGLPVLDQNEQVREWVGTCIDITDRKQAARQIEELARFPTENPFPVLRISQDGIVLYSNQASGTLMKHWDCQDGQAVPERWRNAIKKAIAHGRLSVAEETIGQRVISLVYCPIREENYVNVYGQDTTRRKQAMEHLRQARDQLQKRVDQQTQTLQRTVQNLQTEVQQRLKTEACLRELTEELLYAEERQREQTAAVLHDSIGAGLALSKRALAELEKKATTTMLSSLKHIKGQVAEAMQQTRCLAMDLSPPTLRMFGLEAALEELAEEFTRKHGLICSTQYPETPLPLGEHIKVLLYRSVHELLVNAVQHANAKHVTIQIESTGNDIHIQVEDDGRGFNVAALKDRYRARNETFGLFSIRQRLTYVGGTFDIDSQSGKGTRVMLQGPLQMNRKETDA
jgi:PAS domain S-box-containing protein